MGALQLQSAIKMYNMTEYDKKPGWFLKAYH